VASVIASLHSIVHWPVERRLNFVSGPLADINRIP
jgi:hypothetical protein